MIEFKPFDRDVLPLYEEYTARYGYTNMEHDFTVMYVWRDMMDLKYALVDGAAVLLANTPGFEPYFIAPLHIDRSAALSVFDTLMRESAAMDMRFIMRWAEPWYSELIARERGDIVSLFDDPDYAEYVYRRQDLVELAGKKFSQKRNHINAFLREHTYAVREYTPDMNSEILALDDEWSREHGMDNDIRHETAALSRTLENSEYLRIRGCVIDMDGEPAAFALGAATGGLFTVLFEKASRDVPGLFQIVNREFARMADGFEFIDRQEDMGIPSMRHAKRSYNPAYMIEKKGIVQKDGK